MKTITNILNKLSVLIVGFLVILIVLNSCSVDNSQYDWWHKELNIDTDIEYTYSIEDIQSGEGVIINGRDYFLDELNYNRENSSYKWSDTANFGNREANYYYIEDICWGCRGKTRKFATFGVSAENIDFVLGFGTTPSPYAAWYIAEDYVFPDTNKDKVESLFLLKYDEIFKVYEAPNYLHRVKRKNAVVSITDPTIIDEIVNHKNYGSLNNYALDGEYIVLVQFEGHIVYETITILTFFRGKIDNTGITQETVRVKT